MILLSSLKQKHLNYSVKLSLCVLKGRLLQKSVGIEFEENRYKITRKINLLLPLFFMSM